MSGGVSGCVSGGVSEGVSGGCQWGCEWGCEWGRGVRDGGGRNCAIYLCRFFMPLLVCARVRVSPVERIPKRLGPPPQRRVLLAHLLELGLGEGEGAGEVLVGSH